MTRRQAAAARPGPVVDEADLEIIHALQVHPRAAWVDVARAVGHSPTAVAARWRRLEESGIAWVAVHPNPTAPEFVEAVVELECHPASRTALGSALSRDGRIVSIDESSRGSDLILTVIVTSLGELSVLVLDDLPGHANIVSVRSSVIVHVLSSGNDWRVGALAPASSAALERARALAREERAAHRPAPPPEIWPVVDALLTSGRMSYAELARAVNRPPATVRRHLGWLLDGDLLSFRCDVSPDAVGFPVTAVFFARVPTAEVPRTVKALRTLPHLRMCLQVTGPHNLVFSILGRSVEEVGTLHERIASRLDWVDVVESHVLLRSRKRMGWLLDSDGRRTGEYVAPTAVRAALARLAGPGPISPDPS